MTKCHPVLGTKPENIYKALPSTRLESTTDSLAFNRVSTHLATFKKAVMDQLKAMLEGKQ